MKKTVCVIFGGASSEYEVSLMSSASIIRNLDTEKFDILTLGITKDGRWLLYSGAVENIENNTWMNSETARPAFISPDKATNGLVVLNADGSCTVLKVDVLFPVLHGKNGEDGTIQGLFKLSGIPYVGCGTLASAVCMDKAVTHTLLSAANIEQAHYLWFYADRYFADGEKIRNKIAARLNFPVFVKPANAGSSVGVSKATDLESLKDAVQIAFTHDEKVIIEEFIDGRELEVAVFGYDAPIASYVGEIEPAAEFYDYDDKYVNGSSKLYIPARITDQESDRIRETALRAYQALGCKGLSRVDFFLSKDGSIILNEINTLPGFTSISMYPKLMEHLGMKQEYLVDKLIEQAMENAART